MARRAHLGELETISVIVSEHLEIQKNFFIEHDGKRYVISSIKRIWRNPLWDCHIAILRVREFTGEFVDLPF